MFSLIAEVSQDLRAPSADRRETLSRDRYLAEFHNAIVQNFGGCPLKYCGPKHAKFGEILRNFYIVNYKRQLVPI